MSPLATRIATRVRAERPTWPIEAYPPMPTSVEAVSQAERTIGSRLPTILRELYVGVCNGTFGPGSGLLPIGGKEGGNGGCTVEASYQFLLSYGDDFGEPSWVWPAHLIPLCHWGCEIWSCADCSCEPTPIVRWDPNGMGRLSWPQLFRPEADSVERWLEAWLDGTLRQ